MWTNFLFYYRFPKTSSIEFYNPSKLFYFFLILFHPLINLSHFPKTSDSHINTQNFNQPCLLVLMRLYFSRQCQTSMSSRWNRPIPSIIEQSYYRKELFNGKKSLHYSNETEYDMIQHLVHFIQIAKHQHLVNIIQVK
jgi:hypothetical protein